MDDCRLRKVRVAIGEACLQQVFDEMFKRVELTGIEKR
jgi:hypothetical protein